MSIFDCYLLDTPKLTPSLAGEDAGEWSSRDPTIATVSGSVVRAENLGVTELRKLITSTFSIIKVFVQSSFQGSPF